MRSYGVSERRRSVVTASESPVSLKIGGLLHKDEVDAVLFSIRDLLTLAVVGDGCASVRGREARTVFRFRGTRVFEKVKER